MLHIVKFSGGKDSLATLLTVIAIVPRENIRVVFCDTGWEHPDTYAYLDYIEEKTGLPIVRVKNEKYPNGLADQAKKKGRFPSLKARFCTAELKVEPGIDYVLAQTEDVTVYQGVRADESPSRAMLKRNDEYFRYYFEPWKYRSKHQKSIKELLGRIGKAKAIEGQGDAFDDATLYAELRNLQQRHEQDKKPVFHSYRAKSIRAWSELYSADVVRPVLKWTAEQVISYCIDQGYKLNPLYYRGAKRVGCYPCINSRLSEVAHIAEQDPWRIEEIAQLEQSVRGGAGSTFFANDKIPKRFQAGHLTRNGVTHHVPLIGDVVAYAQGNKMQAELLDRSLQAGCISHYNICESTNQ